VNGAAGVVLVQPMFGFDGNGERIVGWVVAGVETERLVDGSTALLPPGAIARVTMDGTSLYGARGAADPKDIVNLLVGQSRWTVSVTGVTPDFSLHAPKLVLALKREIDRHVERGLISRRDARPPGTSGSRPRIPWSQFADPGSSPLQYP